MPPSWEYGDALCTAVETPVNVLRPRCRKRPVLPAAQLARLTCQRDRQPALHLGKRQSQTVMPPNQRWPGDSLRAVLAGANRVLRFGNFVEEQFLKGISRLLLLTEPCEEKSVV